MCINKEKTQIFQYFLKKYPEAIELRGKTNLELGFFNDKMTEIDKQCTSSFGHSDQYIFIH